jgi:hypothetical protein
VWFWRPCQRARADVSEEENCRPRLGRAVLRDRQQHAPPAWLEHGFYKPDYAIDIPADSVVMTFAALEQISDSFGAFLDFLLAKRPKLCVFVEPIREWYDGGNFIDHLAIRGHDIRNFLKGLPGAASAVGKGQDQCALEQVPPRETPKARPSSPISS